MDSEEQMMNKKTNYKCMDMISLSHMALDNKKIFFKPSSIVVALNHWFSSLWNNLQKWRMTTVAEGNGTSTLSMEWAAPI